MMPQPTGERPSDLRSLTGKPPIIHTDPAVVIIGRMLCLTGQRGVAPMPMANPQYDQAALSPPR